MAFNISIAGKGGTGKTTMSSLIIRQLIKYKKKPILAVDADANANLNEALGMEIEDTISDALNSLYNVRDVTMPGGMTKDKYMQYRIHQALSEGDEVDLLVMGGPEGSGCYCYANNLLRGFMSELSQNYNYMVMDNEAGLEHLSRRTTQNVDVLFVTSDASARGIRSAGRVKELVDKLKLDIKEIFLVVTKVEENSLQSLQPEIERTGLKLAGEIPLDNQVYEYDLNSKPLFDLPEDSKVATAITNILKNSGIL
ncbi:MAG: AAA family ATPase [Clostridiales bacterium]|nr:AAA family ATPase [Clostridiales bacterium]MCF8021942.1 AAA family ATPase [Clostridiales bacterium]